jgi:PHD/YefM family antitoxin component YafN of YafNO toxin-antitoxin module
LFLAKEQKARTLVLPENPVPSSLYVISAADYKGILKETEYDLLVENQFGTP